METSAPPDLSVYDRLAHTPEQLQQLLAEGRQRRELRALFGDRDLQLLTALARRVQRRGAPAGARVYLVPGIMGSQLMRPRPAPWPADLLWIDPLDIINGRLEELTLPRHDDLKSFGALPYSYLGLKLRLQAAGFDVCLYDFDWRQDLQTVAAQLAARVRAEAGRPVSLVAHSMGGLVARAALALPGLEHVQRLVALGAPFTGSFAVVQALRGSYPVVRRLAAMDQHHDAETLAREVFSSFPSLYQMLPIEGRLTQLDLFDTASWPQSGPGPQPDLLQASRSFGAIAAAPDPRCVAIAGTRQRTVTGLSRQERQFSYQISSLGDGTVPLASASAGAALTYFIACEHSELARSESVARAVIDLLRGETTQRLSARRPVIRPKTLWVSDEQLRAVATEKVDWSALSNAGRRDYLALLSEPPAAYRPPA
jgi:pimeloyl-ACP methyl ester carboxylesterase